MIDYSFIPDKCPECGDLLQMRGRDLYCANEACPCRIFEVFNRIMTVKPVDGIGVTTFEKFYQHFAIETLAELQKTLNDLVLHEGPGYLQHAFGDSMGDKLYKLIHNLNSYTPSVGAYFWMANIPRVGEGSIERFDRQVSAEEFVKVLSGEMARPQKWNDLVGDYLGVSGKETLDRYVDRLQDLYLFFGKRIRQAVYAEKPKTKVKFSLTGTLSKGRDELVAELAKVGCEFVSTSKADVFICNKPSSSAKYQEAAKRGIPILTEAEFRAKYVEA